MKFYVGVCRVDRVIPDSTIFDHVFISVDELYGQTFKFKANNWIMDSGGFNEIRKYGTYRHSPQRYADEIARWTDCGKFEMAVAQDYPCDALSRAASGIVFDMLPEYYQAGRRVANPELVRLHQELSVERYDLLLDCKPVVPIMPALQGVTAADYAEHVRMFGNRLKKDMRVCVGGLVWRSTRPRQIAQILEAIKSVRPDLRLHGLGLKKAALKSHEVCEALYSTDSMAWRKRAFWAMVEGTYVNEYGRIARNVRNRWWATFDFAQQYAGRIDEITTAEKAPITSLWNRPLP
jgi:hypothetical protein